MSQIHIPLESVRIASPCNASWESMEGGDKVRHCLACHKNVYNLSDMTRSEAEALISEKEGNLCIGFYQRSDGTIITDDCPIGLRIVRRPFKWLGAGVALLLASGIALATGHDPMANRHSQPTSSQPGSGWQNSLVITKVIDFLMGKRISNTFSAGGGAMTSDVSLLDEDKSL